MWKVFCRKMATSFDEEFYAIYVSDSKWKFSWCLDLEGRFTGSYWDNDRNSQIYMKWEKFDNGEDAAKYIKEIIDRQEALISDVTKDYLK